MLLIADLRKKNIFPTSVKGTKNIFAVKFPLLTQSANNVICFIFIQIINEISKRASPLRFFLFDIFPSITLCQVIHSFPDSTLNGWIVFNQSWTISICHYRKIIFWVILTYFKKVYVNWAKKRGRIVISEWIWIYENSSYRYWYSPWHQISNTLWDHWRVYFLQTKLSG